MDRKQVRRGCKVTVAREIDLYRDHCRPGDVLTVKSADYNAFTLVQCPGCKKKGFDECVATFAGFANFDIVQELTDDEIASAAPVEKIDTFDVMDRYFK